VSSKRYAPLSITPEFPYLQAAGLALGTGCAAAGIVLAAMPGWLQVVAGALLLISVRGAWRQHILGRHPRRVTAAGRDARGLWWVELPGGVRHTARLLPDTTLFPGLIVLRFAAMPAGTKLSIALTSECITAGTWRRLLVILRHEQPLGEKTRAGWGHGERQA